MKKIIFIDGMTCKHCANSVKQSLSALGIKAKVNLDEKTAVIKSKEEIDDEIITKAITTSGYTVTGITKA